MDQFDRATQLEELDRDEALKYRKPEGPQATGRCLYCAEPVEDGRRWCGVECRNFWERHRSA